MVGSVQGVDRSEVCIHAHAPQQAIEAHAGAEEVLVERPGERRADEAVLRVQARKVCTVPLLLAEPVEQAAEGGQRVLLVVGVGW